MGQMPHHSMVLKDALMVSLYHAAKYHGNILNTLGLTTFLRFDLERSNRPFF